MRDEDIIIEFIRNTMPTDISKVIVDVGANSEAIFSANFVKDNWQAILIEPQPECVKTLRSKFPNITVIQKACNNKKGYSRLYLSKSGDTEVATLNTNSDPWMDEIRSNNYIDIECDTLTNILDENNFPTEIGILKVDAESFDPNVIEGLDFKKYNPLFVVTEEYYWEPKNLEKKYNILEDNGYILLGYVQYNSIWRKKDNELRFTTMMLREVYQINGLYPSKAGDLPLVGRWK
jgi:FkbM family methyltransferase